MKHLQSCPLCGCSVRLPVGWYGRIGKVSKPKPLINKLCLYCGLVSLAFQYDPVELTALYTESYDDIREHADIDQETYSPELTVDELRKVERIGTILAPHLKASARVLEIGAGRGLVTHWLATHHHYSVLGIEPSEKSLAIARKRFGLELRSGTIESVVPTLTPASFDVVIMHHVFEHMYNLADILKHIHSVLNEQGIVYIAVPSVQKFTKPVNHFFDPLHLYSFSETTLIATFAAHGFSVQHIIPTSVHAVIVFKKSPIYKKISAQPGEVMRTIGFLLYRYLVDVCRTVANKIRLLPFYG